MRIAVTGEAQLPSPAVVHLVPHTHWDREWYLPFQAFRMRLVAMVDGLVDDMTADPRTRFTLDGQTATVDDYLEVRPEREAQLAALVARGQLSIGPWHILMDEFLVSGETIVRNLELGIGRATRLGGVMRAGYLPDMFGHIAQMPQILARAGIDDAVVWRGVPWAIDVHAFTWRSPDGSAVRCEYLYRGYGNARELLDRPEAIAVGLDAYRNLVGDSFGSDHLLAMYGEDHSIPGARYADIIDAFNAGQDRYRLEVATLAEYLEEAREGSPPHLEWTGELRSSARANVLMGVVSHHADVRAAAARTERTLERLAEPIAALHSAGWPERYLELAWQRVIENSAHDSICACSADEVVAQVLVRFAEAEQIGRGILGQALAEIGRRQPAGAWVAVNPSPMARTDLVELLIPETEGSDDRGVTRVMLPDGTDIAVQELERRAPILEDVEMPAAEMAGYLRVRMHANELYRHYLVSSTMEGEPIHTLRLRLVPEARAVDLDLNAVFADLDRRAAMQPGARWRLLAEVEPRRRVLAAVPVSALGWVGLQAAAPGPAPVAGRSGGVTVATSPVTVGERRLTNGLVTVAVASDGTLTIDGGGVRLEGVGRLVDGGDVGDAYNYAPPPRDTLVERPTRVRLESGDPGQLRGTLSVLRTFEWPAGLLADLSGRTTATRTVEVRTVVELRSGEPFVRLGIAFDNTAVDHRLRFHVPLPAPVEGSWAEGQFAVVERGLVMEGGHGEFPLPTFPAHGFVAAEGVVALLTAVTEYEIVSEGRELALTLLRATGRISRDDHPLRAEPAGPTLETPSAQRLGLNELAFAILPHAGAPDAAVLAVLERYRLPLLAVRATGPAESPPAAAEGLRLDGDGVVLSALRRRDDALEVRLVNETAAVVETLLTGAFARARDADLMGVPNAPLPVDAGTLRIWLGAWEIRTLHLLEG